ncbi:tripartite tricarboxylate transporter substrate binding protein [Polynucleobacter sp. IMCC30063]|nr:MULTISPECIES: tripartite tricarboxylate transporter substrate binding protein [unclassified Polynucleobacter]MCE7506767.1 tripartite tricarboxylate transporter substrate binding protein [Polynucleobacter sp. IMCC30063]MCE7528161.1 tripartite tricarboxylate transporter substrate binding protein [Polynucleobacter sp. IMCC 30228]MCE7529994.1 tripartite tricarboxylate transporter substrate binding protein [Polynucleobacter sp. IMCC 29146]
MAFAGVVVAQTWPTKPITLLNPFPAGGGTDAFARPLAAQLGEQLGVQVLIDNRGGAGGTVGASVAAKAPPDGYSWFIGASHHTIAPSMYKNLDYDIEKSFIPVALIASPPQVLVVNPQKVSARDLKQFIELLKKNPGKYNFASAGSGTVHHLAGELFKIQTGTFITHIPYRGAGPAMNDLLAGQVDLEFDGLGTSAQQINGGKLFAIAVASPKRSPAIPNVPTFMEAGLPNYEVSTWYAMFAPKGTPKPIVDKMIAEVEKALNTPKLKAIWASNGSDTPNLYGEAFGKLVNSDVKRWAGVVKKSGATLD